MWQISETIKLFLIAIILLVLVKPHTGVELENQKKQIPLASRDIQYKQIYKPHIEKKKLTSAIAKPLPRRIHIKTTQPQTQAEVASFTIYKPPATETPENANQLIDKYALEYGADANLMKMIAKCESGFRPDAVNNNFAGMYQFLASTWESNRNAMGLSPDPSLRYDAEEAIKTAAFKMGRDGYGAWPSCYRQALVSIN